MSDRLLLDVTSNSLLSACFCRPLVTQPEIRSRFYINYLLIYLLTYLLEMTLLPWLPTSVMS